MIGPQSEIILHTTRIRYFLTYCESLNFSNAARKLNISQPALTRALARLEEELGAPLVRREGKRTHLTPFGTAMLRPFKEFVDVARKIVVPTGREDTLYIRNFLQVAREFRWSDTH